MDVDAGADAGVVAQTGTVALPATAIDHSHRPRGGSCAPWRSPTTTRSWQPEGTTEPTTSGGCRQAAVVLKGHTDFVRAVAFSTDGTMLVSGSGDGTVNVWRVPDSVGAAGAAAVGAGAGVGARYRCWCWPSRKIYSLTDVQTTCLIGNDPNFGCGPHTPGGGLWSPHPRVRVRVWGPPPSRNNARMAPI
jgi:WD40 repeat protein